MDIEKFINDLSFICNDLRSKLRDFSDNVHNTYNGYNWGYSTENSYNLKNEEKTINYMLERFIYCNGYDSNCIWLLYYNIYNNFSYYIDSLFKQFKQKKDLINKYSTNDLFKSEINNQLFLYDEGEELLNIMPLIIKNHKDILKILTKLELLLKDRILLYVINEKEYIKNLKKIYDEYVLFMKDFANDLY